MDKDIQELISRGAITGEINAKAIENGMITMAQDGVLKVLEGETTLEEVERATELWFVSLTPALSLIKGEDVRRTGEGGEGQSKTCEIILPD